jgi:hypothetical protein
VSVIGRDDAPARPTYARAAGAGKLALQAPLAVAPAPHGQIAIAGSAPGGDGADGSLVQGSAGGPFSRLGTIAGQASPTALTTAYLGDVAAAWPSAAGPQHAGVRVAIERYFAHALSAPLTIAGAHGAVHDLTVALAYRTDAIAVWTQAEAIYARDLPASGEQQPTQRLAAAGPHPTIAALISDDRRAIVAWSDERAGRTSIYLDVSADGVRFGAPRLLERFADPGGGTYPAASPRLVRLSSEGVMLAWTGVQRGHWVVRTAAIDLSGAPKPNTISSVGGEALLSDLASGPDDDAFVLWSEPQRTPRGTLDPGRRAIYAARGTDSAGGTTSFAGPELVAPPAPGGDGTIAVDPASDRALALWPASGGALDYAIRASDGP